MSCILVGRLLTNVFVEFSGCDTFHNTNRLYPHVQQSYEVISNFSFYYLSEMTIAF